MKLSKGLFKGLYKFLAGLGVVGIVLFIMVCFVPVVASVYGLVLAFKASLVLGLLSFLIEPSFVVYGLVMLFGGVNLPERIVAWFNRLS